MKDVTAAILYKGDRILIAKRKFGSLAGKWEFPGGKVEPGETPEESLKREMREEFGIEVSVGSFFGETVYDYPGGAIRLLAYECAWEKGKLCPTVHEDYRWVRPEELVRFEFAPADEVFVRKLSGQSGQ